MDIKKTEEVTALYCSLKATLENISERVGTLPQELYGELESAGAVPAGPMIFAYSGMDGDPKTEFDVDVALPVTTAVAQDYSGRFNIKQLEAINYVERVYEGPVSRMGSEGYGPLYGDLGRVAVGLTGQVREVYLNWVEPESEENITGIQVGVTV